MNKTSKDMDLSSIITQVSKDDDPNRSMPLTNAVITSGTSPITKSIRSLINKINLNLLFSKLVPIANVVSCPFYSVV